MAQRENRAGSCASFALSLAWKGPAWRINRRVASSRSRGVHCVSSARAATTIDEVVAEAHGCRSLWCY